MEDTVVSQAIETVVKRAFPNQIIRNISIKAGSAKGDNFLGVLYAIAAQLEDEDGIASTKHLVLKTSSTNEARKKLADNLELFDTEATFYMGILPALMKLQSGISAEKLITPAFVKCYGAMTANLRQNINCDGTQNCIHCQPPLPWDYILLEDMREVGNYKMASRFTGLDFEYARLVVLELARYHALTYAYLKSLSSNKELFTKFPFLKESLLTPTSLPLVQNLWENQAESSLTILRRKYSEESPEYQKLQKAMRGMLQITSHMVAGSTDLNLDEMLSTPVDYSDLNLINRERKERNQWLVLVHGDAWVNNFLFQYNGNSPIGLKMVDLQIVREICLTADLNYFFYMSTTAEIRNEHLNTLLEIYFNSFMNVCDTLGVKPWTDFTLENLKQKYKKTTLFGAVTGLCKLPLVMLPTDSAADLDKEVTRDNLLGSTFAKVLKENVDLEKRLISTAQESFESGIFD